jgi:hypothetical protein
MRFLDKVDNLTGFSNTIGKTNYRFKKIPYWWDGDVVMVMVMVILMVFCILIKL